MFSIVKPAIIIHQRNARVAVKLISNWRKMGLRIVESTGVYWSKNAGRVRLALKAPVKMPAELKD